MKKSKRNCIILGGGGHARVLIDALQFDENVVILGILDPDPELEGKEILGIHVLGSDNLLPHLIQKGLTHFLVGVGTVGDDSLRYRLYLYGLTSGLEPQSVKHPSAVISKWAKLGRGYQIMAQSIVNAGVTIGENVILNSGAIVEHDCILGNHIHIATGAHLASTVTVGDHVHIGVGASIRQCISIGKGAVVGGGAMVVNDVSPRTIVVGNPARPLIKGNLKKKLNY